MCQIWEVYKLKTNVLQRSAEMHGMAKLKYDAYYL